MRSRNWDGYAAAVATFIGLLALVVSGYTAYVQREQLRAQVWPYLTVSSANVAPDVGLHVINSGTGPARIVAVRVTVDKRLVSSWWDAQRIMGAESGGIIESDLGSTVLPAGKDHVMVRPFSEEKTPRFIELFLSDKHAIAVSVCYCSVLSECWVVSSGEVPVTILGTVGASEMTQGEIPWRTEFGSLLHRLRHQKNDSVLQELARVYVVDALKRWEPRIVVTAVTVQREQHNGENVLAIRIRYDVISMNTPGNNVILSGIDQTVRV